MRYKILLINMGLSLLTGIFIYNTIQVWRADNRLPIDLSKSPSVSNEIGNQRNAFNQPRIASKSAFQQITNKNLFAESRTEYQPVATAKAEDITRQTLEVDGKKITLFGILHVDADRRALISDPESKPGVAGTRWVKIGDSVGQLRVEQISKDNIIIVDAGKKYQIDLYDQENKQRGTVAIAPENTQPTVVVTQQPAQSTPKTEMPVQPAPQAVEDGYEMIKTPFGMVKRKK